MLGSIAGVVRRIVNQGIHPGLPDPLKKRIRLTNILALFGAFVMLASIPFDRVAAPRWMLAEDVLGALAFLSFPLLNRRGYLTASRLLCIAVSNLIVLGNAVLLGPESGAEMVFIALCAVPFALFDLGQRRALLLGVLFSVGCFALSHSGLLARYRDVSPDYNPAVYTVYSALVTLVALLFCLYQTSLANAEAERALRLDIARRERAERELENTRQSSIYSAKMAALGEMSGNIAHEVNNPLTAISLRAQRLSRLVAAGRLDAAKVAGAAREMEATAQRIRRIVDALRSFARDAEQDPMRPELVAQIVSDTVELCAQRFRQHEVELVVEPIAADLSVACRGVQISQILLNLLGNAHDAVEDRATRRVRVVVDADEREVRISVLDNGPGIPPELEGRVMEPFFTTKEIGKGTGLGLSVSKGIAEAHGGSLAYQPTDLETRFVLRLPRSLSGAAAGGRSAISSP